MSKIDEYNRALRHDLKKASVLRQEALLNIEQYVKEYNLSKHDKRDFDLVYSEETYHMMQTYVRVFGTLTKKVRVDNPVNVSFSDVLDKVENDYPPNCKKPYWKDKSAQFYYNKSKRAYKRYLSLRGEDVEISPSSEQQSLSHNPIVDVATLLREDFGVNKTSFMSRIKERISSLFASAKNKRKKAKLQHIKAKQQKREHQSQNTTPKSSKNYNKRILGGLLTGVLVIGGILGINKLSKKVDKENNSNTRITPAQTVKPTTTAKNYADTTISITEFLNPSKPATIDIKPIFDTSAIAKKNAYADILANKLSYYQQKSQAGQDTVQTAQKQTAKSKVNPVKSTSTPLKVNKPKTPKPVVAKTVTPDTVSILGLSDSVDTVKAPVFDSIIAPVDTVINPTADTIATSDSATLFSFSPVAIEDSIISNGDTIISNGDTISNDTLYTTDSITSVHPNQVIDSIAINSDTISNQLSPDEMPDGAFENRRYKKHIAKCDSIMAIAFNGEEQRDEFYQTIYNYIDSGNFTPTPEMHLTEFATYLAVMQNISSDSTERRIAEDIFSGKKLTDKQQEYLDNLPKWNFSLPKRIEQMGVKFYLEKTSKSTEQNSSKMSQKNTTSSYNYYQNRINGNNGVAHVLSHQKSGKIFKSNNQVLQKLYKSGRLS